MTRMPAAKRKEQIVAVTTRLATTARHRSELTAAKVAAACGISETMLWRLASAEFRAIRDELPGGAPSEGLVPELRRALREARADVRRLNGVAREHERCPSQEDVLAIVEHNERLAEDNRSLRADVHELRARLAQREQRKPPQLIQLNRSER